MRGKAVSTARKHRPAGITPAYAGKSKTSAVGCPGCRDHPRACGEKFNLKEMSKTLLGSPPRMRGIGVVDVLVSEPLGITPACAGKSLWSPLLLILAEDHPRVCGEKDLELYRIMTTKGSPPRVRGKAGAAGPCTGGAGITPACAGKSCPPQAPTFTRQDHPRACGEKGLLCPAVHLHGGSPPRVRGKAERVNVPRRFGRITPAYAGKSSCLPWLVDTP